MIDRELIFTTQYNGNSLKNGTARDFNVPYSLSIIPVVKGKIILSIIKDNFVF